VAALIDGAYSEVSPSDSGILAIFLGSVPANRKDNRGSPQVEFFTSKGFVTVTGKISQVCTLLGLEDSPLARHRNRPRGGLLLFWKSYRNTGR